ncbi:MAG: hypothetical protein ABIQ49_07045 [Gemmatimonadales bacterium]
MLASEGIFDLSGALVEPAQAERAEVDVPLAIVDLNEADGLTAERDMLAIEVGETISVRPFVP